LFDWSVYLNVFNMIGWSKMNESLHDMTINGMFLDVSVSQTKSKKDTTKNSNYNKIDFILTPWSSSS